MTQRLARLATQTTFGDLSPHAVREAKRRIIDSIACATAASDEPFCRKIRDIAGRYGGDVSARIWGTDIRTSVEMAAFANGVMVRYLDFNDTCLAKSAGHPSDMIGGLVALAESFGLGGSSLLSAVVIAYEVYCGLCTSVALQAGGLDQSTAAALGSAAGASHLLGLTTEEAGEALSLALAPNLHLYNVRCGRLSDWKACAGPNGTRNGLFAALLARDGITGPTRVFDGAGGLFDVLAPFEFKFGPEVGSLITATHLKYHPVCYHGQSAVDAAIRLHKEGLSAERISDIHIETYEASVRAMADDESKWAPATRETADHSLPYTVAVVLLKGRIDADDYAVARLDDLPAKDLMQKVRVSNSPAMTDDYPKTAQTRITVRSMDGATYQAIQTVPKGNAGNPLADAELEEKLRSLYPATDGGARAGRLLDLCWSLERCGDVGDLVDAIGKFG